MKRLLFGLALLPFLSLAAHAQPSQLSESQMDGVTAGFGLVEHDISNTSTSAISIYKGPIVCQTCYLNITSTAVSVVSNFGQTGIGLPVYVAPNVFPSGGGGGGLSGGND
jgi:hypothetical protein